MNQLENVVTGHLLLAGSLFGRNLHLRGAQCLHRLAPASGKFLGAKFAHQTRRSFHTNAEQLLSAFFPRSFFRSTFLKPAPELPHCVITAPADELVSVGPANRLLELRIAQSACVQYASALLLSSFFAVPIPTKEASERTKERIRSKVCFYCRRLEFASDQPAGQRASEQASK